MKAQVIRIETTAAGLTTARWPDAERKKCEPFFTLLRRGKMRPEQREILRDIIRGRLAEVSAAKLPADAD